MDHLIVRPESPSDRNAVREVNQSAFGSDGEAGLVESLRERGYVRVSLVAEMDGKIVGHILFSDLQIINESSMVPALALAPMAVLPEFQTRGIGSELVRRGMLDCAQAGHRIVVVLGHREYYPRFGFSTELAARLESPYPREYFMAAELVPGALDGVYGRVEYAPPFQALEAAARSQPDQEQYRE